MTRNAAILAAVLLVLGSVAAAASAPPAEPADGEVAYAGLRIDRSAPDGNRFVGSPACASCHRKAYDGWKQTFHSTVIQDARKNPAAILPTIGRKTSLPAKPANTELPVRTRAAAQTTAHSV